MSQGPSLPQLYDVVDDNDQVIGQAPKQRLHKEGFVHRGVNVLFYTKAGQVILQRRAANKNTFPNKLDVTVGGHVDAGETYEQAGLHEIFEETSLRLQASDLNFLTKIRRSNADPSTGTVSNYFSTVYAYNYEEDLSKLQIESGKAAGFVSKPIQEIIKVDFENPGEYSTSIVKPDYHPVWKRLMVFMYL